jgi:pyridoxamine 5'-phosphate oxidase
MNEDIASARMSYERGELDVSSIAADPFAQFRGWFDEARAADVREPHAMTLATVNGAGQPAARTVLLRAWDERGFVFFTNYRSRKGSEIAVTPLAALLFFWAPLERQIRIEGKITQVDASESDAYFASRPRGHRLSAWASPQSAVVPDRATLETQMSEYDRTYPGDDVPRPPFWGGYRVQPARFEFWQGRPNRVHDRIVYERPMHNDAWSIVRLAP